MKKWLSVLCVLLLVAMSSAAIAGDETKVDAEPGMQIETVSKSGKRKVAYYPLSQLACDTYQDGKLISRYDPTDTKDSSESGQSEDDVPLPGLSRKYYYPAGTKGFDLKKGDVLRVSLKLSKKTDLIVSLTNGTYKQTTDDAPEVELTCTYTGNGKIKLRNKLSRKVTVDGTYAQMP